MKKNNPEPIIMEVRGKSPRLGTDCRLAPNATLAGDIRCGDNCTFWFNAVVRGDVASIQLGNKVNIQDGAIIHGTYNRSKTILGNQVSVGHNAIIHGCTIEDNVLVGMGAIIMDNAHIGSNVIIGAGAVVLAGTNIPSGTIYAGIPAKKVKDISPDQVADEVNRIADAYLMYAGWFGENFYLT